jgi:hypothetical protein
MICARRAAWWRLLSRCTSSAGPVELIFGDAAIVACYAERDQARFWRDIAADWRARAEGRPTSDAAGALMNWHELGVAE